MMLSPLGAGGRRRLEVLTCLSLQLLCDIFQGLGQDAWARTLNVLLYTPLLLFYVRCTVLYRNTFVAFF